MADLKPISAFNAASAVDANTLFLVSTPNGADYDSENASAALVADAVVNDFEYTQDLSTVDKTISGAINENKSVIGYSYDAYDATTAYSTGDLCIYNNVLYKAKQATTGNLPTNTTYWELTSIADEIGRITEITTGIITPSVGIDLSSSDASLETKNGVTNVSISLGANGTASLARWGSTQICTVSVPPRSTQRYLTRARLGANDWFSVLAQIATNGVVTIVDVFGVTAGTITGYYLSATYLS